MFVRVNGWWAFRGQGSEWFDKSQPKQKVQLNIDNIVSFHEIAENTIFELINGDKLLADVRFEEASNWDIWEIC